jgi:hypothetical protein
MDQCEIVNESDVDGSSAASTPASWVYGRRVESVSTGSRWTIFFATEFVENNI